MGTLMLAAGIWAGTGSMPCAANEPVPAAPSQSAASGTHAGAAAPAANTGAFSVDTLMHAFAQRKSGEARFTELKYLSNLKGPVESSGTLAFRAPDHFEQQTLKPRAQSVVVDGDTVTMSRGGSQRVVSLSQYPEIAMLVNSIRGTLTGDRSGLERVYTLALTGDPAAWHLTLTPADPSLAKHVDHIVVSGAQDSDHVAQIQTIETFQADGDRSVMTIETGTP
jgi:outer membrane lipoprotein-sorting protein